MRGLGAGIAGLFAVGFVLANVFFVVDQTEQALVLQFGKPERVIREPGLNAKIPFIQNVEYFDNRLLDFNDGYAPIEAIAADQKRLIVDSFLRYRIVDPLRFKQAVGDERNLKGRLNAILESSLRQVIGSVALADVVSEKRAELMRKIRDLVNAQVMESPDAQGGNGGFGIEVLDVRIERADLPPANSEGIYKRMQSERKRAANQYRAQGDQDAQKIRSQADKERTILLADARKQADITRGEGDGEATHIFAESFGQDQDFFQFYRTLQAYRKTLSAKDTTLILSPDNEFLKYLQKGAGVGSK